MTDFFSSFKTVLFQGDSITDCNRDREDIASLGNGYPLKVVQIYKNLFPQSNVNFVNKGISGNRVPDLLSRYQEDFLDIKPDFISILIGINDTWQRYTNNDPTSVEDFENNYNKLLSMIKRDLPNTKIMILEPFLLTTMQEKLCFREDLNPKIDVVRKLAAKYADFFLPMDGILASAVTAGYTPAQLSEDGVHPVEQGHAFIAYNYMKLLGIL